MKAILAFKVFHVCMYKVHSIYETLNPTLNFPSHMFHPHVYKSFFPRTQIIIFSTIKKIMPSLVLIF